MAKQLRNVSLTAADAYARMHGAKGASLLVGRIRSAKFSGGNSSVEIRTDSKLLMLFKTSSEGLRNAIRSCVSAKSIASNKKLARFMESGS